MRKLLKSILAVLLVFAFSSVASALSPEDALSVRPAKSVYASGIINPKADTSNTIRSATLRFRIQYPEDAPAKAKAPRSAVMV